jgi:hypothetical protein
MISLLHALDAAHYVPAGETHSPHADECLLVHHSENRPLSDENRVWLPMSPRMRLDPNWQVRPRFMQADNGAVQLELSDHLQII